MSGWRQVPPVKEFSILFSRGDADAHEVDPLGPCGVVGDFKPKCVLWVEEVSQKTWMSLRRAEEKFPEELALNQV